MFKSVWLGLDVGSYSVKAVEITRSGKQLYLTGTVKLRLEGLEENRSELAYRLFNHLQEARIGTNSAVLGVPQKSAILSPVHVPRAEPVRVRKMLDFEMQQMAERVGDTTRDYQILSLPGGSRNDVTALIGLARNEELSENYRLMELAKISVRESTIAPFALFHAYKACSPDGGKDSCLLVNIGHEFTDVVVVDHGELIFARSIGFGGKHFTEAVAGALRLSAPEADALKIAKGSVQAGEMVGGPDQVEMEQALRAQASQMANTLVSTLKFCQTQLKISKLTVDKVYLSGGGAKLRGMRDYLQSNMNMKVENFNPFQTVKTDGLSEKLEALPTDLAIAIGLAAVGLRQNPFTLDLLPIQVKQRREFLTRKLFSYVAAGILAVMFLVSWGYKSWAAGVSRKESEDRQTILKGLEQGVREYEQVSADIAVLRARMNLLSMHAESGDVDMTEKFLDSLFARLSDWPSIAMDSIEVGNEYGQPNEVQKSLGGIPTRSYVQLEGSARETRKQSVEEVYQELKSFLIDLAGAEQVQYLRSDAKNADSSEFHFKLKVYFPLKGAALGSHP